ncbi:7 transmembrane sweet-taste receptor of 3 GCPR-domain-containing protein [Tribonema minus]|uniref:7 transmembrane sweet-taste receptor of 3 GCPR-domain-containing protein n=1 Tax=Tribonema minus TaxID=303371 RepID=A0A835ZKG5_9STRA|nr:7 transmembrane sweet-taste receptor of 3 GCPR-domain-containing protein [Tribonema minus]
MKPPRGYQNFTTLTDTQLCNVSEYRYDKNGSFYEPAKRAQGLVLTPTWFYTNTLDQNGGSSVAATGTASVHLAEVGVWQVCLMRNRGAGCSKVECVQVDMYQPPYDYVEADAMSITDSVRIRYNLVSHNSYPTDWLWFVGSLPTTATIYNTFGATWDGYKENNFCWAHQWGSLLMDSGGSGNLTALFGLQNQFTWGIMSHYYLCGVKTAITSRNTTAAAVSPIHNATVTATEHFDVTIKPELGGAHNCVAPFNGTGFNANIRTTAADMDYLDIPATVSFKGGMKQKNAAATVTSILLPAAGTHEVGVTLESRAKLSSYSVRVEPSQVYAQSAQQLPGNVIPASINTGGNVSFSFVARDLYLNPIGKGGAHFEATIVSAANGVAASQGSANVTDHGNGTYTVDAQLRGKGTETGQNSHIPGSPFEIYVVAPEAVPTCGADRLRVTVGACKRNSQRRVTYSFDEASGGGCTGGKLPAAEHAPCDSVRYDSSLGVGLTAFAGAAAAYALGVMAMLRHYRDSWVIKYSQILFCALFLGGCAALSAVSILHLGPATPAACLARPWLQHVVLTFTLGCLLVHRAYKLFSTGLKRMRISNAELVSRVVALCSFDILILTIWYLASPPKRLIEMRTMGAFATVPYEVCHSDMKALAIILWAYKGVLIAVGAWLAFKSWKLVDTIAEAKPLAVSIYNILMLVLINAILVGVLGDGTMGIMVRTITINVGCIASISLIFLPKWYKAYMREELKELGIATPPVKMASRALTSSAGQDGTFSTGSQGNKTQPNSPLWKPPGPQRLPSSNTYALAAESSAASTALVVSADVMPIARRRSSSGGGGGGGGRGSAPPSLMSFKSFDSSQLRSTPKNPFSDGGVDVPLSAVAREQLQVEGGRQSSSVRRMLVRMSFKGTAEIVPVADEAAPSLAPPPAQQQQGQDEL